MSDETSAVLIHTPSAMHEHYCEHPGCKAWGGFGYDIGKGETRWYCHEHQWEEYPQPKNGKTF